MKQSNEVDVVVSGGGATGWSFLLALKKYLGKHCQLNVALIDAFDASVSNAHPGFDARALALSQQSLQYFRQLGLEEQILVQGTPIKTIHVSDQGGLGQVQLKHQDYQLNELGAVMEAQQLGMILLQAAESTLPGSGVILHRYQPDKITSIETKREGLTLTLSSGVELQTRLLILAEGSYSQSSQQLGLPVSETDYQQHAIITNVQSELPHENIAWERFTPSGPLALLPMSQQRSGVVWSVTESQCQALMQQADTQFLQALQQAFGFRLGHFMRVGSRQTYQLKLRQINDALAHRVVCIGNAAQTLHPIAGQGFNLAFRDAWQLASSLAGWQSQGLDVGDFKVLHRFKELRSQDRQQTIDFTDSLVRLFSNDNSLVQSLRNAGLMAMQHASSVKTAFARLAMGQKTYLNSRLNKG